MTTAFCNFYDAPSPANAIELAIADHRAQTGGGSHEFIDQLQAALAIVKANDKLRDALAACVTLESAYCFNFGDKQTLVRRLNAVSTVAREALK